MSTVTNVAFREYTKRLNEKENINNKTRLILQEKYQPCFVAKKYYLQDRNNIF